MLRWGRGKGDEKKSDEKQKAKPQAPVDDELAFLRSRADFDEEEMASVRSGTRSAPPGPAASEPDQEPSGAPSSDEWAFLRARAREDAGDSVFAPAVEPEVDVARLRAAASTPAAEDPEIALSAEDHRIGGLLNEVRGVEPQLSDEDLRISELLNEAMGFGPSDGQVDKGR